MHVSRGELKRKFEKYIELSEKEKYYITNKKWDTPKVVQGGKSVAQNAWI